MRKRNTKLVRFTFAIRCLGATIFLLVVVALLLASTSYRWLQTNFYSNNNKQRPLNIILLYGDDWRHDSLGIAGRDPVHTPFLDRLASREGVRFTESAVTTSVCWISRATLHTGQYLSRHESFLLNRPEFYKRFNESFPVLLKKARYHLGHVGKWHYQNHKEVTEPWYDFVRVYEGQHWFPKSPADAAPSNSESNNLVHITKRNQRDSIQFLRERPRNQPFYLTVAFFAPHAVDQAEDQYFPQPQSMILYQNVTLLPPQNMEESWKRMPNFFTDENQGRRRWSQRFDVPEKYDRMMKNYYRLISEVDAACEKIFQEIERQGILDETLIIFTTDNGYFHAEHGLADKWYPHAESVRVPLIVRDPRMPWMKRGTTEDALVLSVDLAPTILAAANVAPATTMQGQDFAQLYLSAHAKTNWRQDFFYEHPTLVSMRSIPASTALISKEYKYIHWPDFDQEQLFDLRNDPGEETDLVADPRYAHILERLEKRHNVLKQSVV